MNNLNNNLVHVQRWIPVTERLPKCGEPVLTCFIDGDVYINHLIDCDDMEWFLEDVVAWMSLPEPYMEE